MVARIDDNTGFSGMMFHLGIPPELELTGMQLNPLLPQLADGFRGVTGWDGVYAVNPPVIGNAFVGWSGAENIINNGDLITYTLRVRTDALPGHTAPLTISFANAMGAETPTDNNGDPLIIALPNSATGFGAIAEIGNVNIRPVGTGLSVSGDE